MSYIFITLLYLQWLNLVFSLVMKPVTLDNTQNPIINEVGALSSEWRITNAKGKPLTGRFLHITDMHLDAFYREGATVDHYCHDYKHMRDSSKTSKAGFLTPGPGFECDSSPSLIDKTLEWFSKHIEKDYGGIDFIIWTGDNSRHDNDNHFPRTKGEIIASNEKVVDKMVETFPDVPLVAAIGNNDVYPHNILEAGPSSITQALAGAWDALIPTQEKHVFEKGGYYMVEVIPRKLAVIAFNSLYFSTKNAAVDGCPKKDPDEPGSVHIRWLRIQFSLLRQRNMFVWLASHVPPTRNQWYLDCYEAFTDLLYEFRDVIVGQLYGHMNINHFFLLEFDKPPVDTSSLQSQDLQIATAQPKYVKSLIDTQYAKLPFVPDKPSSKFLEETVGKYSLASVGGSIIPEMFPNFRIYTYNISGLDSQASCLEQNAAVADSSAKKHTSSVNDLYDNSATEDDKDLLPSNSIYESMKQKYKKKKKKHRKKKKIQPGTLGPAYVPMTFTPLSFQQMFLNTSNYMDATNETEIHYKLLYDSRDEPYNMPSLTVPEYMRLARRIAGVSESNKKKKKKRRYKKITYTYLWHAYIGAIPSLGDPDNY
ncbi:vacuolar polyphosphatase [Schizosaccharomyces cryophilus OY26]|uniref:Endopolyphosphatase n=1 Tax=Schizosaccharomyces cryophilus (strain OY26 / ATCC MYA-4695 / CBS 11777 / NBRC 106824 / NRRL Y48691) TaxID=653667 RepID=S9XAU8_SCHCR|nr:vacuolar polyphosphatase [Schizosaccharomyces cryophilus OY26]EPY54277.1 vacuolar polyphosphatase [Schizosaccharomyces cryophilus OY26]